jgi:staphylococcal nuclease domain-containing protein 1
MASGYMEARVKSVLSGDTLILHNVANPKQERTLSLAYVSAPRLRREGDEPFAFESRDFLRKALVGKPVRFRVLYKIPTGTNREYGIVTLQNGSSLPEATLAEGWVKLRDDAGRKDDGAESQSILEKLQAVEAKAKADGKGLWAEDSATGRIESINELPDAKAFADEHKGKTIEAIVEKVLSGDRLIVRLLVEPKKHIQTMLLIAGIRAPSTQRTNPSDGQVQPAEPFGEQSQQFVEVRLLQRSVQVVILGSNPAGQLIGTVKHPTQGSIAPHILKDGLARCTDHHSTLLGSEMGQLRQAEKFAKDNRKGLFHGHVAQKLAAGEMEGVVSRVFSADTLFLRNKSGQERRVNLSSVRQPKPTDPKQSPFGAEAKEFLRKKLIGKHVKFTIDGKRPASEGYDEREMATVTYNKENVAMILVKAGYASVIRHRHDDTDRSPIYDDLLLAEEEAQKEGKGMWNPKPPAAKQYVDYSESLEKAKRQLTILSRRRKVPAVVDFVKSGSRFTLLVPQENAKLTFVLSGIRAPKSARNPTDKGEPFGQEAHDFANKRCLQRDVEIDVEDCDKVGGFIGTLYVNRESFAKVLVEEGLASVHAYSAEKSGNFNELNGAEKKAKEQRKGIWQDWDPSQDEEADGTDNLNGDAAATGDSSTASAKRAADYRDVVVTNVGEDCKLKLQQIGTNTTGKLTELMNAFRTFHLNPANKTPLPQPPKAGDIVAAQFSEDGEWYRARIRRNDRDAKKADVLYIDYGNEESVPYSKLRPLNQTQFSTQTLKPQAVDAVLSFCQFPVSPEYLRDGVRFLQQEAGTQEQLVAKVNFIDQQNVLYITLLPPSAAAKAAEHGDEEKELADSFNAMIIDEGLAMVPKKLKPWERAYAGALQLLKKRQAVAQDERRGMWEYGDLTEDD